jgi:hypothetical protein
MENFHCYNCGFMVKKKGYLSQHHKGRRCQFKFNEIKHEIYQNFKYNMDLQDINYFNNLTQKDSLISFCTHIQCKYNLFKEPLQR